MVKAWLTALAAVLVLVAGEAAGSAAAKQDLTIPMDDGVPIAATLYVPDGAAPAGGWPAIVFLHGRRGFQFSPDERQALKAYVDRGGILFADAICASTEFADAFRREIEAIFPGQPLTRIPPEHPLFTRAFRGFDLPKVTLRDPQLRTGDDPRFDLWTSWDPIAASIMRAWWRPGVRAKK